MSYAGDREWSDQHLPEVKRIVGPMLLEPAQFEIDAKQSTDLIILAARDKRIAVRIRRPGFLPRYQYDFTVRARRDSGAETELMKMQRGFADWMFYGHARNKDGPGLAVWYVLDLDQWRYALMTERGVASAARQLIPNGDGTHFVAFDVREFGAQVVLASSITINRVNAT